MPATVHPLAHVEAGATLGDGVRIGPFCHVGADVVLGDNVELMNSVTVVGATTIGEGSTVFPGAVLGCAPQNARHTGGRTTLVVGKNCTIRESVTMHTGTDTSRATTIVGDNCNFLAFAHIAHDCIVGNNATFANGATLGGHCELGDYVNIGGLTAVHQFTRIGDRAFIGGCCAVVGDVIPFAMAQGNRAKLRGLNIVGLRRAGFARAEIFALRDAYRKIFDPSRPVAVNLEEARSEYAGSALVMKIVDFMTTRGKRHFTVPPLRSGAGGDDADDDGE